MAQVRVLQGEKANVDVPGVAPRQVSQSQLQIRNI